MSKNDALPLEYKLNEGRARRQVDAGDFVNDTFFKSEGSVLGLGFEEEIINLVEASWLRSPIIDAIFN